MYRYRRNWYCSSFTECDTHGLKMLAHLSPPSFNWSGSLALPSGPLQGPGADALGDAWSRNDLLLSPPWQLAHTEPEVTGVLFLWEHGGGEQRRWERGGERRIWERGENRGKEGKWEMSDGEERLRKKDLRVSGDDDIKLTYPTVCLVSPSNWVGHRVGLPPRGIWGGLERSEVRRGRQWFTNLYQPVMHGLREKTTEDYLPTMCVTVVKVDISVVAPRALSLLGMQIILLNDMTTGTRLL